MLGGGPGDSKEREKWRQVCLERGCSFVNSLICQYWGAHCGKWDVCTGTVSHFKDLIY